MEIKKVNVGIKSLKNALGDFVETGHNSKQNR